MRYFKISEFDSGLPNEEGTGKNRSPHLDGLAADIAISDSVKRALFVGHALQLVHELGLPFRVGIAGSGKGNFCHIDIDEERTNPRLWIY